MPQISITVAQDMLNQYIAAEKAVLQGQAYTIGNRSLTRANLNAIREGRKEWEAIVEQLSTVGGGSMRVRRIVPRDD